MRCGFRILAAGLVSGLAIVVMPQHSLAEDQLVDVSPDQNVDENLFVERAVATVYNQMPQDMFDAKLALPWCEQNRLYVKDLRAIVVSRGLDGKIVAMLDDLTTLIDAYEDSLATLGEIDRQAVNDAIKNAVRAYASGTLQALKSASEAADRGGNDDQQTLAAAQGFFTEGLKDYAKRANESRARENDSAQTEKDRFFGIYKLAMKHNAQVAQAMTASHGWEAGEAGFEEGADRSLASWVQRRPRDPFAKSALALEDVQNSHDPEDFMRRAHLLLEAARLVPNQSVYHGYRVDFLSRAAWLASSAASAEIKRGLCDAPTADSQEAINLVKSWLAEDPQDPGNNAHMQLSRVLADAGRFNEALGVATPLVNTSWGQDWGFCLRYSMLEGVSGHVDNCLAWLKWTFKRGFSDVDYLKNSPDFDSVRKDNPQAWADLFTAKGDARIVGGFLTDDITFHNQSAFPMTNVTLKAVAIKGGKIWRVSKVADRIEAGESITFESVFSIPDGWADTLRWNVTSDQGNVAGER